MGIDVVLMRVAQHGTSPRCRRLTPLATVTDEDDVLARTFTASGTPMLSRADPYRDLILSPAEMEQFIEEAGALIVGVDETCGARLHQVLDLAHRCQDDLDTELHFREISLNAQHDGAKHASTVAAAFDQRAATYDDSALHRDLAIAVARFSPVTGVRTVLDVATGTGLVLRAMVSCGASPRLIGADISAGMLAVARAALPDGRFLQASADRLPVADGSVDLVTCVTAMHLMAEPEAVLAEFARVLAANGRLVLATFRQAPDRSCADRPYRTIHPRFATAHLVGREAAPAGFTVSRSTTGTYGGQHCLLTELTV